MIDLESALTYTIIAPNCPALTENQQQILHTGILRPVAKYIMIQKTGR